MLDESDCDLDGRSDALELALGARDCNENGVPDGCDVESGSSQDVDGDGTLDGCEPSFHSANAKDDGVTDLSDALHIVRYAFPGAPPPTCLESADVNDDSDVDIADAIDIVMYVFLDGAPVRAPGASSEPCGPDPDAPGTRSDLSREACSSCE